MRDPAATTITSMSKESRHGREMTAEDRACAARLKEHWDRAKKDGRVQSQEQVAHQLGVTQGAVWQMLHGRVPVSLSSAMVLAHILNCDPREISVAAQEVHAKIAADRASGSGPKPRALVFTPTDRIRDDVQQSYIAPESRYVPLLEKQEVARHGEILRSVGEDSVRQWIGVTSDLAPSLGPDAFALEIEGDAMKDELQDKDIVIVDPSAQVRPGDIVVAVVEESGESRTVIRKYRDRGEDEHGHPRYELAPVNGDYPTIRVDTDHPGWLIAPVVEYRRRIR